MSGKIRESSFQDYFRFRAFARNSRCSTPYQSQVVSNESGNQGLSSDLISFSFFASFPGSGTVSGKEVLPGNSTNALTEGGNVGYQMKQQLEYYRLVVRESFHKELKKHTKKHVDIWSTAAFSRHPATYDFIRHYQARFSNQNHASVLCHFLRALSQFPRNSRATGRKLPNFAVAKMSRLPCEREWSAYACKSIHAKEFFGRAGHAHGLTTVIGNWRRQKIASISSHGLIFSRRLHTKRIFFWVLIT